MLRTLCYITLLVSVLLVFGCKISGTITDVNDEPVPDVTVSLGDNGTADTVGDGSYEILNLLPLEYSVTPSKEGYVFEPTRKTVTAIDFLSNNTTGVDFVATEAAPTTRLLAVAWNDTDTKTGLLSRMNTVSPWEFQSPTITIAEHSVLRSAGGRVFAISNINYEISIVTSDTWTLERVITFTESNRPIDLIVTNTDTAYITRDASSKLLKLDLSDGSTQEVVDLSIFADADGNPDLGWMVIHEGRLFVQIRRINLGAFIPPAYIAVINLASEQILDTDPATPGVQAIELQGTAAKRTMQVIEETRRLGVLASGGNLDNGGIELIDLDTLQSAGLVVQEATEETGTDLESFLFTRPDRGYFNAMTDIVLSSHLTPFSVADGVNPIQLYAALFYEVEKMVYDHETDTFFMPEGGSYGNGIRVFDASNGTILTPDPVPTNGTPTDVVLLCDGTDGCIEPLCLAPGACSSVPCCD